MSSTTASTRTTESMTGRTQTMTGRTESMTLGANVLPLRPSDAPQPDEALARTRAWLNARRFDTRRTRR